MDQLQLQFVTGLVYQVAVPVLVAVGLAFLRPLAGLAGEWLKARLSAHEQRTLDNAISMAIKSAEQSLPGQTGAEKKAFALDFAQYFLNKWGAEEVDISRLSAAIEAGVLEEKRWFPKEVELQLTLPAQ